MAAGSHRRHGGSRRAAHDPGPPRFTTGRLVARGADGGGARRRHRARVLPGPRSRTWCPSSSARRYRDTSELSTPSSSWRWIRATRKTRRIVSSRADPRRHLRKPAEAQPRTTPRAVRRMGRARQSRARPRAGVRGDPRLPPRAGPALPDGARAARRCRTGTGPACGSKLGAAGRRAFARGDMPAAVDLLRRAGVMLPPDDPTGIDTRTELGEALSRPANSRGGWHGPGRGPCRGSIDRGRSPGGPRAPGTDLARAVFGGDAARHAGCGPRGSRGRDRGLRCGRGRGRRGSRHEDDHGDARDHRTVRPRRRGGRTDGRERTPAGDTRLVSRAAAAYATTALYGPTPVREVLDRCQRLLDQVAGDRNAEATVLAAMAIADAMLGDIDSARDRHRRARAIQAELDRISCRPRRRSRGPGSNARR